MLAEISMPGLLLSFTGGLLSGLNPCCYSVVPGALGYLGGFCRPSTKQCLWLSFWMRLGIFSANMILGSFVIFAGKVFGQLLPWIRYLLALVPIAMGLIVLQAINIRLPTVRMNQTTGMPHQAAASYVIGLIFSLAVLPCATPILASILSYASTHERAFNGMALVAAYGIGISLPVFGAGAVFGAMSSLSFISRYWVQISRLSGTALIGLGLYLLWTI
ncbi:cytochrome c biogenesis CcdA family protein [bacterium]|nr:cytochrome c biogenesis CcdA family protein [bacterium]